MPGKLARTAGHNRMVLLGARFAQWVMSLILAPGTAWSDVLARVVAAAPEAVGADRLRNLVAGR